MSLQLIFAFSREQIRKEPPILRCKEYVSSGGGVRRCLSITGIRLWILSVVDWDPKSKDSVEAKASPRIITASTCAFSIAWTEEMKINHYILDTKCCRSCKQKKVLNIEINMCVCVCETLDSYPVKNFISIDFFRTPSRSPSTAERMIWNHKNQECHFSFICYEFSINKWHRRRRDSRVLIFPVHYF